MPDAGPRGSAAPWELAGLYLLHPNNPKGFSATVPSHTVLTAGNDREMSRMTVQSETLEKFISLSTISP